MCVPIFRKSSNALMRSRRNISSPLKAYGYGKHYLVKYRTMKGTIWVLLFSNVHIHFLHLNSLWSSLYVYFRLVEPFPTVLLNLFFLFLPCHSFFHSFLMLLISTTPGLPYIYSVLPQVFYLADHIISIWGLYLCLSPFENCQLARWLLETSTNKCITSTSPFPHTTYCDN